VTGCGQPDTDFKLLTFLAGGGLWRNSLMQLELRSVSRFLHLLFHLRTPLSQPNSSGPTIHNMIFINCWKKLGPSILMLALPPFSLLSASTSSGNDESGLP